MSKKKPKLSYPKGAGGTFAYNTNSLSFGYGSKNQDERGARKTKWATKNPDKLLSADELIAENKRREQQAIRERLGR